MPHAILSPLAGVPVEFLGSDPDPLRPIVPPAPEFAFIGRSNVGKSSLLNALLARRAIARVSSTPGKTQLLNIYRVASLYLLDVPGYGYASASKAARGEFHAMLTKLVRDRSSLTGVVWLLDIRHSPSAEDRYFHGMLAESGRNVLTVLTKADKLSRAEQGRALTSRVNELGLDAESVEVVSAQTGLGIAELATSILSAAGAAA